MGGEKSSGRSEAECGGMSIGTSIDIGRSQRRLGTLHIFDLLVGQLSSPECSLSLTMHASVERVDMSANVALSWTTGCRSC